MKNPRAIDRDLRKGEPPVVEIRTVCITCKDEVIHGRRWWRKNLKGFNGPGFDSYRYEAQYGRECRVCERERAHREALGRVKNEKEVREAAIEVLETLGVPKERWHEYGLPLMRLNATD